MHLESLLLVIRFQHAFTLPLKGLLLLLSLGTLIKCNCPSLSTERAVVNLTHLTGVHLQRGS